MDSFPFSGASLLRGDPTALTQQPVMLLGSELAQGKTRSVSDTLTFKLEARIY